MTENGIDSTINIWLWDDSECFLEYIGERSLVYYVNIVCLPYVIFLVA
jgi:hypothetical protein